MKRIWVPVIAAILALVGVQLWSSRALHPPESPAYSRMVEKVGYYPIGQSGCWVKVFEDKNGELNVETRLKPPSESQRPGGVGDCKSVEGYIDPKEPWCVYIQDESTIWIYHSTGAEKQFSDAVVEGRLGLDRDALLGGKLNGVPAEFLAGIEKVRGNSQQDPENATE